MEVNSGNGRQADRPLRRRSSLRFVEPAFEPTSHWMETPDAHVLVADLPGFKIEDVKVQVDDGHGNLIFSGERSIEEMVFLEVNSHHRQRPSFKFTKVVSIPKNVDTTSIGTRFENDFFHITINKLRHPIEVKSTNILDQEKKGIPEVGESSARFIEESKEKKDGKESNGEPEKNVRNGKAETLEVVNSSETQVDKLPSNKLVQSTGGEKDETLAVAKLSETQGDKPSSNKNGQSLTDDKVGTSRVVNSSIAQDDKILSKKWGQSQRDLIGSLMRRRSSLRLVEPTFEPQIEWRETPETHVLVAELPGFKIEDVKVQLDDLENLIFSGERSIEEMVFVEGNWRHRQRPSFKFRKVVNIPKNVDTTSISTRFENELFHITINKLRPPTEVKSTNILEQEKKSTLQVSESSAIAIEESKEKKDDKGPSGKLEQNLRDGKVETSKATNSSVTQVDKAPINKLVQRNGSEKDGTLEVVKFSATQDEKASSNKNDQIFKDDKVETSRVSKSSTTQDDTAMSNKLDQIQRDKKVDIKGIPNSSTTQDNKAVSNEPDQIPRDEKIETLQITKSIVVQDDKASNNQPNQSPIDKKVEISKVIEAGVIEQDNEKFKTLEAENSRTTQDTIQLGKKLQDSNKGAELAKDPSLLNKEKIVDSNAHPKQFELLDFDLDGVKMNESDQPEDEFIENKTNKRNPTHEDAIQEMQVSRSKVKKTGKGGEDKETKLQVCPDVNQLISSRCDLKVLGAIIFFSIILYIIYTIKYP